MNWKVYLEDDEGNIHKGIAHYVHEEKRGVEVRFSNHSGVFIGRKCIKKFTKKLLRK